MRPELIVVNLPLVGGTASLKDRYEDLGVEQLVADATVERLDMGVLRRLARIRKAERNAPLGAPSQHRVARKLRPVIEANHFWGAPLEGQVLKAPDDVVAAKRKADFQRQALSRVVVDNIHRPDGSAIGQPIVHEVYRPTFIRAHRRRERRSPDIANLALLSWPDLQAVGAVDAQESIIAHEQFLAFEQDLESAPPPARSLHC